jgi:hypothetical protein
MMDVSLPVPEENLLEGFHDTHFSGETPPSSARLGVVNVFLPKTLSSTFQRYA